MDLEAEIQRAIDQTGLLKDALLRLDSKDVFILAQGLQEDGVFHESAIANPFFDDVFPPVARVLRGWQERFGSWRKAPEKERSGMVACLRALEKASAGILWLRGFDDREWPWLPFMELGFEPLDAKGLGIELPDGKNGEEEAQRKLERVAQCALAALELGAGEDARACAMKWLKEALARGLDVTQGSLVSERENSILWNAMFQNAPREAILELMRSGARALVKYNSTEPPVLHNVVNEGTHWETIEALCEGEARFGAKKNKKIWARALRNFLADVRSEEWEQAKSRNKKLFDLCCAHSRAAPRDMADECLKGNEQLLPEGARNWLREWKALGEAQAIEKAAREPDASQLRPKKRFAV